MTPHELYVLERVAAVQAYLHRAHNLGIVHRDEGTLNPEKQIIGRPPQKGLTWWEAGGLHSGRLAAMSSPIDKYGADKRIAKMLDRDFPIEGHNRVSHIK